MFQLNSYKLVFFSIFSLIKMSNGKWRQFIPPPPTHPQAILQTLYLQSNSQTNSALLWLWLFWGCWLLLSHFSPVCQVVFLWYDFIVNLYCVQRGWGPHNLQDLVSGCWGRDGADATGICAALGGRCHSRCK